MVVNVGANMSCMWKCSRWVSNNLTLVSTCLHQAAQKSVFLFENVNPMFFFVLILVVLGIYSHFCIYLVHKPPPPHTTVLRPYFRDHPGEPVPEENFWTLWCKGTFTEADIPTIRLGATACGLHQCQPPSSSNCRPTNNVKALKAASAFGLGKRR